MYSSRRPFPLPTFVFDPPSKRVFFFTNSDDVDHISFIILGTVVCGLAVAALVLVFSDGGSHPTARMVRCSMGFLVSIAWIMAIADEAVNVLQVRYIFSAISFSRTFRFVSSPLRQLCLSLVILMTYPDIWIHLWALGCHNRAHDLRRG